jgi:hypothetical protein
MEGRRTRRPEDEPATASADRRHVDERRPRRAVVDRERQRGEYGDWAFNFPRGKRIGAYNTPKGGGRTPESGRKRSRDLAENEETLPVGVGDVAG